MCRLCRIYTHSYVYVGGVTLTPLSFAARDALHCARTQNFTRRAVPPTPSPRPFRASARTNNLPVCTPTTLPQTHCTRSWLPWRFTTAPASPALQNSTTTVGNGATPTMIQLFGNASQPPIPDKQSIVVPILKPPLIRVAGTPSNPINGVTFRWLHVGYTRDPCPSQFAPGSDGSWSQAWHHPTVAPDVPRGSVSAKYLIVWRRIFSICLCSI